MNDLDRFIRDIEQATADNSRPNTFGGIPAIDQRKVTECAELLPVAEWYEARCLFCDWTANGESHRHVVFASKLHVFHTGHEIHIDIKNIEAVLPKGEGA